MTAIWIILLFVTSILGIVYTVSTAMNAWRGKGWFMRLVVLGFLVFLDLIYLDALNIYTIF